MKRLNRIAASDCRLLMFFVAAFATGCDLTGQYDKKFQEALQTAAKNAVYQQNLFDQYTDVMDAANQPIGVKLRLPKIFKANASLPPLPLPPTVKMSMRALQGEVDQSGQKLPCVVMLLAAEVPKANQKGDEAQKGMMNALSAFVPNAKTEDVSFTSPAGQAFTLKRLRTETPPLPAGKGPKIENRVDMYQVAAGNYAVMILWTIPKNAAQQLDEAINASMGTLEVTGGPAAGGQGGGKAPGAGCF